MLVSKTGIWSIIMHADSTQDFSNPTPLKNNDLWYLYIYLYYTNEISNQIYSSLIEITYSTMFSSVVSSQTRSLTLVHAWMPSFSSWKVMTIWDACMRHLCHSHLLYFPFLPSDITMIFVVLFKLILYSFRVQTKKTEYFVDGADRGKRNPKEQTEAGRRANGSE